MNKEELLKQIEEAKNKIVELQNDIDKMQNAVDTVKGSIEFKNDNSNTNKIDEIKEFIEKYWIESVYDLVEVINKKFDTNIKCKYISGFNSSGYNVTYYTLSATIEDELFFHIVEEQSRSVGF